MSKANITKRLVDSLTPGPLEYFVWDEKLTGFGVRVQALPPNAPSNGRPVISYVAKYRAGSGRAAPTRRITLGRAGILTPDEARVLAKKALGAAAAGADPAGSKAAERKAPTVSQLSERFLNEHVQPKRKSATARGYRIILKKHVLPRLGARKAAAVTPSDVSDLHLSLHNHPTQANRMLAVVSAMYEFGGRRNILARNINPARGIEKYREKTRDRYLSDEELARIGDAIREAEAVGLPYEVDEAGPNAKHAPRESARRTIISPHAAAAIRLLIFTGARLREILHLSWDHVDLKRGLLLLPDSKTGKKTIVLNVAALDVLTSVPRLGEYVIAGQSAGSPNERPRADLNKPWRSIIKRAGLPGLRIHDLRHTHASIGAGAGLGLTIIGKLLGHAQPVTTARYAHLDADPLRRASEQIGRRLLDAMGDAQNKPETARPR